MKQITVETTGNFMLVDPTTRHEIPADGAATVPHTAFIDERLGNGDLREVDAEGQPKPEPKTPAEPNPLDHDGDGKAGGSLKGDESTAHKGAAKRKGK